MPEITEPAPLAEWNDTEKKYPECDGLQQLFEQQVKKTPDAIAVFAPASEGKNHGNLTYRELNRRANQLAWHLKKIGVGPDVVVGICAERTLEMTIGVVAVIKAGGAYVPLDPNYPKERLAMMLEDTKAPVILTQEKLAAGLPAAGTKIFRLDTDWQTVANESEDNLPIEVTPENLAYLIYTSGSTGRPKGVAMRQEPLINLLFWQAENWSYKPAARTLQFASLNFDVSFQELFSTWCSGGTLVLIGENQRRDSNLLVQFLQEHEVERLFLPFVALKHLADAAEQQEIFPKSLKEIITAGEQLQVTPQIIQFFTRLPGCTLENQYGPSETHVVTAYRLQGEPRNWPSLPSIGRPIANTQIYLLDEQKRPVANGEPGELFIGGVCLARGYLNRPDLTAEKFIPNPFSEDVQSRLYKTGDLARYLPDGNIEFLGRTDHQVKVRGFRIELGEIEAVLSHHPAVREVVVVAREITPGEKRLVAYIVPHSGQSVQSAELRNFLKEKVPVYFVPSAFVTLSSLPLTPNGKVDRRALPEPAQTEEESSEPIKGPRNPLEMQLQVVFERFLNRRPVGIDVSFFELGGDSLQALKLIVEIERVTRKKLPLGILFQASTVEDLAKTIREQTGNVEWSALVPLQPNGTRPPLFLVHTTPGDVLGYGGLVYHMNQDQPCFGLQSVGLKDEKLCHTRVEEMAAYYNKLIRAKQPQGPYFLGGWCYGGIVAVEMAHQLLAAGQKVAPLILIETPAPAPPRSNLRYYFRRIGRLLTMNPQQWKTYLSEKVKYYRGVKTADDRRYKRVEETAGEDQAMIDEQNRFMAQMETVYSTNMSALRFYKSRFYPGKIILFNAAHQDPAIVPDPQYGWPPLVAEVETHVISGSHDTVLMEPHVKILAQKLTASLQKAQP